MDGFKKQPEKPKCPFFSSGPCKKHPFYSNNIIKRAFTSRSHRSKDVINRLKHALYLTYKILKIPNNYKICMMPGSDTGAMETAIWNLLGYKNIDCFIWGPYGNKWYTDIVNELKLNKKVNVNKISQIYGLAPTKSQLTHNINNDLVIVWNETPTGVYIPDFNWISNDRNGLVIVDGTSGVFGLSINWEKIDVLTFSWQKMLGGEAGNGMLILSPRAIKRLENYIPEHPIPSIYHLKDTNGKVNYSIFEGQTNNTYSVLLLEDYIMSLEWVEYVGGIGKLQRRVKENFKVIDEWIKGKYWVDYVIQDEYREFRSPVNTCLKFKTENIRNIIIKELEKNNVAYDIKGHVSMGSTVLRIWSGPTINAKDLKSLLKWIEHIHSTINREKPFKRRLYANMSFGEYFNMKV